VNDTRHNARILALQKIFEISFPNISPDSGNDGNFSDKSLLELDEIEAYDTLLAEKLVAGVKENFEDIDKIIAKLAPQWPVEKINKIDLQILRIAIFEGFISKITPEKVALNEAIELTKDFSNEQSRKFVNGVLGNLLINKSKYIHS
jgi:transcription antitermination protein NusB